MTGIPTRYDPKTIEAGIYSAWSRERLFHADEKSGKKPYCIVIPPPNVTGILHMGHALNNTLQDILIRWKRMQGFNVLWMPGTDHAGIATQNVVEREIAKEGLKRADLGREKFLEKVWQWKEESGSTIIRQLKRLGCSCDWDRTRFTMDEGLSNAVREVFVRLYDEGLLYKGDYIINWCPRCGTALSDEEAEHRDVDGMLYYIKYPVAGREKPEKENEDYVVVATTRPETMLGDVAVAVNPKDPRYSGLCGKKFILPILKRELALIKDDTVDPSFGTGALKVTPAHDPVDFELGQRHGLERINVMRPDGTMNELCGDYEGMDRFECREAIIEDLKERKLFVRTEKHAHSVGHCYRCHTVVEPRLSKQWFVRMKPLAKEAIEAVTGGRIKFYPERWTKVYLNWMENIRDWCVSRQIWWGHRIPVWYCKDCLKYDNVRDVAVDKPGIPGIYSGTEAGKKCASCGSGDLEQDPDVLDTWFSSWLWPFSTLGWPDNTPELKKFYPTDVLVTAPEIIFFWVARMIMSGIKFMGKIPFSDVYIHGTVRDVTGTKMSKSLGNVIDPIDVIDEVGSDALRFSVISITSQGQDVFLSREKFELGRNFANKLWNASRYVLMNIDGADISGDIDMSRASLADSWILDSLNRAKEKVTESLGMYRFNDATSALYDFIWHKYCDWYLECSKLSASRETTRKILVKVLKDILGLLHPFMPFITEEIWQKIPDDPGTAGSGEKNVKWLMLSSWPCAEKRYDDEKAAADMEKLISVIAVIRNVKAFWNISPADRIEALLNTAAPEDAVLLKENAHYIEQMARCRVTASGGNVRRPAQSVASLAGTIKVFVPLGGTIDVDKEKARIEKKVIDIRAYLGGIEKKLANRAFVDNAPEDVVAKEKEKKQKFTEQLKTLEDNLAALE
ncbi:MAG: valine--tRNA ligase [Candidatus Omnitrophota bacterium]